MKRQNNSVRAVMMRGILDFISSQYFYACYSPKTKHNIHKILITHEGDVDRILIIGQGISTSIHM